MLQWELHTGFHIVCVDNRSLIKTYFSESTDKKTKNIASIKVNVKITSKSGAITGAPDFSENVSCLSDNS